MSQGDGSTETAGHLTTIKFLPVGSGLFAYLLGHANAAYAGIVNLKLEFAEATVDQKARARNLEPGTAVAGGTKIKISSL